MKEVTILNQEGSKTRKKPHLSGEDASSVHGQLASSYCLGCTIIISDNKCSLLESHVQLDERKSVVLAHGGSGVSCGDRK